jgi:hypothetical protein
MTIHQLRESAEEGDQLAFDGLALPRLKTRTVVPRRKFPLPISQFRDPGTWGWARVRVRYMEIKAVPREEWLSPKRRPENRTEHDQVALYTDLSQVAEIYEFVPEG